MIEIKFEDGYVNLFKDYKESPIYYIIISDLSRTRIENDNIIADWINQLMTKTWMEETTLYELAAIIQNKFPENNIDWIATFFPIEKKQYVNHVSATKKLASGNTKKFSGSDNSAEKLRISVEEQTDFVNENIKEIIKNNLKKYRIQS